MSRRGLVVAIDGPSGAGKGTVSRTLASRLGYRYVDTGAMYRAVAWKAREDGVDLHSGSAVAVVASQAIFTLDGGVQIDGHDVTSAIRTPDIDEAAAIVARHSEVRAALVQRQRGYDRESGLVMEGRDIGTVVFPDADVKLYLDADPAERARRRATDATHAVGRQSAAVESVAEALEARDLADRTRTVSPLTVAPGAIYIDTTGVAVDTVVTQAMDIVRAAIAAESESTD
jgi:cytidylate kinase